MPTIVFKKGRKPKVDIKKKTAAADSAELVFTFGSSGGARASFENLFLPSGREEGAGLTLCHCCGSIGFPLNENLSEGVFKFVFLNTG